MINLPRIVMALFGISAVLDIAEKIHNWGRDKKNEKEEEKKRRNKISHPFLSAEPRLHGRRI